MMGWRETLRRWLHRAEPLGEVRVAREAFISELPRHEPPAGTPIGPTVRCHLCGKDVDAWKRYASGRILCHSCSEGI